MAFDFSNITDEELEAMAAQSAPASEPMPQKPLSEWTDEELEAYASEPTPAPAQPAAHSPRMTREERIAANNRAIETARSQEDPGFLSAAGEAIAEGAKGAARAVKSIGSGIVGMASGAVRLAGTPVRAVTGWEGLHRLADTIDSSYENFGADALMSDYGENPDGFGFAAGRFGEKLAGTAGSLAALGGVGKAVGAAGTALKAAGHAKTAAAVANTLPLMFGNDAAVRAYDTARANGKSKGESAALAGLNGAIHFLGFKAFENKALNKMLGMPAEMEGLMPKWAGEAAEAGEQSFSSLARGVRNGMIKYTLAERGKGALKAGGIMGLQDMLSDPVMQVAEGASIDDIDFTRMLKAGASGLGEGALMEGALGAASVLKSPSEARKFIADKIFRGKDYKVMGSDGKMHDEPGLLNTSEGRMVLMKQNPDATERVLDIVEHGGTPRPAELDAAFLPPDMTAEELKKFASDWRNDLKPYVDEAWAADAPRQTAAPDATAAEPGRDMLSPEEAQSQQKAANDAAERQKVADRRAAADSMMLDFESWNRLYADGKTDLNFDEWRAAGKPGVIEANLTPKTEEAPTSETRANEEPAQPEQAEVVAPPAGAEARPVESAEARAEAADARVVESPAKPAEAAQKPAEAAAEPKVSEDTPAPAKPAEVASRVSYATPERKAPVAEAEDAPLPSFLAPETAPAEPPAPKSKRLRRADGTDPLVTPAPTGEVASPEPTPASVKRGKGRPTMTPEQKAKAAAKRAADKVRKIADISRDENGAFRTDMLKASESNPGGLSLKELASLKADKEWHRNLGLPEKDADALRAAVEKAHDDKYLEYHYQSAHDKFADYERGNGDLAFAYNAVSDAASRAKTKGDTVGEQLLQPMLKSLTDKIGALPKNEQNKILAKSSREADTLAPKERKNRKSLTTKEGKEVDVATSGEVAEAGEAEEAPDEYGAGSRFNRIEANDDDSSGRSAPKGATGTGGSLGGNRHLIIDGVKGDELTVTAKDAAGKTLATRKMNRAQWSALSQGAVAVDGDPANPQKGDLIRRSRNGESPAERDLRFASDENYQKWLKSRKANDAEPLRERYEQEQAKAAKSIARNTLPGVDVEVVDRAFNPETDGGVGKRKSISGIYTGTAADYANRSRQGSIDDGPSLHKIGTGEGSQVYGWGLYGSNQRGVAEEYANRGKYYKLKFDGKDIGQDGGTITAAQALYESGMDYDKAVSNLKKQLAAKRHGMSVESVAISDAIEILESNKGRLSVEAPSKSYVYEQTFFADRAPGDESHLLSWYEPLGAEKAKTIVDGAKSLLMLHHLVDAETAKSGMAEKTVSEWTGKDLYKKMASVFGEEQASRMLRSMGIDGIKYPADSFGKSIKNGDRTGWDYVSFRDDNIRVDHKWEDGQMRYLRDGEGRVVGTFDRSTNKVTLYRGASAATLVHELGGHATLRFAEQEAERGNRQLLDRINRAIDEAPQALKDEIRSRYPGVDETALRDEIWAALRERNSPAMEKAIKTLQGKAWYNRAWSAFRDAWKGLLARMGFNRADLSQIDKMSNDEFLSHLDRIMSDGKTLGRLEAMGEGTRNAFAGEKDNEYEANREDAAKAMPDTKIVGSDGKPVAGYHFTKSKDGFTVFDREKSGPGMFGKAFYFFPSKRMAENWGNFDGEKRKVIGAYLDVKKPWVDSLAGYDDNTGFDKAHLRKPTDAEYATLVGKLKENGYEINPNYSYDGMTPYKYVNGKQVPVNHGLAFLSNALVHKSDRGGYGWKHAEPVRKALEELGYDGVVGELDGYTQIAVFEPNQIKSADSITYDDAGNPIPLSQRFNPKSDDIREARSPRPAGSRIMDDQQTKGEKFTEKFIDSLAPVKSVQDELGGVKEVTRADGYTDHTKSTDLVAAKDKANGRLEHEVRQHQFRVDDINRDLARAALPKQSTEELVNDFNLYLQCKHAPERNLSVAQDRGDAYTPDYSEGMGQITLPGKNKIGLSENVANRLLKGMRGKYGLKFKMFENAADKVYKMLEADLDRRFDAGRLSAEDYAFYKTRWHGPGGADGKWAHYVPLKTDMERLEPEALNSSTAGMKRNEFMKAQGRGTGDIADSPLAAAVLQTEQGIRGSIRNEVANVEANLVEHAQKQGIPIAEIVPGDEIRRGRTYSFTFADGETVDASGSMRLVENHPEIHLFKRDGKLYAIRYDKGANGRGLAFARAASGENMGRWGQGTEWIPRMTHWMSAMRTQYSPEFTVSNWLADHLEAAQALVGRYGLKEGGKAFAKTVASEIRNAKDLFRYLNGGQANGYIKEFVEGGGLTKGGVASEGFDAETQKIRSKIEQFRREQKQWREMSPADLAKSAGRHVADFLSFANELAEYSTRTGLYTALRKQGVPKAEAIKFARDATVNFNRKGTAMPYINGLYMFANASVQGAVRSVQAMRDTHGKELIAALTAIGVAKAVIDNYLGNDDEREAAGGRNARNQSEYDKKHNVGVPIGGGRQIVPLRFRGPYAAVPYLAQTAANVAMGVTSPEDGAKTLFRELGDQVTDLVGGNGIMNDKGELDGALIGQSIAPSVADPIVQLATGKDYKGEERRQKSFDKTMPASSNGKRSTASGYKWLAKGVNAIPFLSGGNEFRKGRLDFSPEDYKLVLEFLLGAPMRDFNNVVSSVDNAVQLASGGTPERTLSQIPFVRRVVREYPESTSRYYDALEDYERDKAEFKKTTPERRKEMKADKPYLFTGKSLLDGQIERIKELTHLERGEVKVGQKWVEPKTPRTEEQKEKYRKLRLEMQARVLKRLDK